MSFIKFHFDKLHFVLIAVIVLVTGGWYLEHTASSKDIKTQNKLEFLLALHQVDSLITVGNYELAIKRLQEVNGILDIDAILTLVEQKKLSREQVVLDDEQTTNTHPSKNTQAQFNTNDSPISNPNNASVDKIDSTSKELIDEFQKVTSIIKGVLKITNFDGADINYIGEVENNKANGFGFAVFEKKGFYEGQWSNNMRNGKGIYYWQNGDTYEGNYKNGFRYGYGVYTFKSGETYKGNWADNLRQGTGSLFNKRNKLIFEGEWLNDEPVTKSKRKKKKKK